MKTIVTFLLIFCSFFVSAKECKKTVKRVDMTHQVGPIKDQDGIGWCYAFAAADILNQHLYKTQNHRFANHSDSTISPTSLALLYNQLGEHSSNVRSLQVNSNAPGTPDQNAQGLLDDGGYTSKLLDLAFRNRICLEGEFKSTDLAHVPTTVCNGAIGEGGDCGLINTLSSIYSSNHEAPTKDSNLLCERYRSAKSLFPALPHKFIWKVVTTLGRNEILPALINKKCNFRRQITNKPPQIKSYVLNYLEEPINPRTKRYELISKNAILFTQMDRALQAGNVVSASIFPGFLNNEKAPHATHVTSNSGQKNIGWNSQGTHAVTVVGMQLNPETCEVEYRIKNSWGRGCDRYKTDPIMERKTCITLVESDPLRAGFPAICNDPAFKEGGILGSGTNGQTAMPKECEGAFKTQEEINIAKQKCREIFQKYMTNTKLRCEGEGYVIVPKSQLAPNLFGVDFLAP